MRLNRTIGIIQTIIFSTMLFFILLFTSIQLIVYNMDYFERHYEKRDIMSSTGMEIDELMTVTVKMMDYLIDKRETLDMTAIVNGAEEEVFGEREKLHMMDVKNLFLKARNLRTISVIYIVLMIVYMFLRHEIMLRYVLNGIKYVFLGIFGLFGILGVLLLIDFNKYFTIFHLIFFDNDLWLLNPNTDILINMVPEGFFFETSMWIIGVLFAFISVTLVVAQLAVRKLSDY